MRRATVRSGGPLLLLIVLAEILTGCGSFTNKDILWSSRLGFRPDEPTFTVPVPRPDDPTVKVPSSCEFLNEYIKYAGNLKEAYRTRTTQNRSWIYVAAITGLGVAAASGALAAASAVSAGTLALLAISGGFTAGAFATIDNSELANVYTVAANDIGTAVVCSVTTPDLDCSARLRYLTLGVTSARHTLETARTSSAAGALARATAQRTLLDQEITKAQQAKDAADKAEAATKAQKESSAAADDAKEATEKANKAPLDANAQTAKKTADDKATEKEKVSNEKGKEAKDANAKLKAVSCPPVPESK